MSLYTLPQEESQVFLAQKFWFGARFFVSEIPVKLLSKSGFQAFISVPSI
jgi:hypothetical protein